MLPIIPASIPPQSFEVVRDQIAGIIAVELAQQAVYNPSLPQVQAVYKDRFIPINLETEVPCINVSIHKGNYDNMSILKSEGEYVFNIDVYTTALTSVDNGPGDERSMLLMNRLAGVIRAILDYPDYCILGLTPGIVGYTKVLSYSILDKGTVMDALSGVVGRLQFWVRAKEQTELTDQSKPINELTTTIKINETELGFFYDYKQKAIVVTATGVTMTDAFFSNPILEIVYGQNKIKYLAGTDFTQDGTTITAATFTFTQDDTLIAQTA